MMGRGRGRPRPQVYNKKEIPLRTGRVISTGEQIAPYYGGMANLEQAIENARELGQQLSVINEPDYRKYFPEIDYDRYDDDIGLIRTEDPDFPEEGRLSMPDEPDREYESRVVTDSRFPDGDFAVSDPIPDEMDDLPVAAMGDTEFDDRQVVIPIPGEIMGDAGMTRDYVDDMKQKAIDARQRAEGFERAMTDYVGREGDTQMYDAMEVDRVLAEMRRKDGRSYLGVEDAEGVLERNMDRLRNNMDSPDYEIDQPTGLRLRDLRMLLSLPPQVQAMLPQRLREILTLGGITTGLLSDTSPGDEGSRNTSQNPAGPLSGLMN